MFSPALLGLAVISGAAPAQAGPQNPLVGTWLLDRLIDRPQGGAPVAVYGEHPIGQFIFTNDGHFAISVMRDPAETGSRALSPNPGSDYQPDWLLTYFGTYRYDDSRSSWIAHVVGANSKRLIGTDQTREVVISGDTMTVTASYTAAGGAHVTAERTLHRAR